MRIARQGRAEVLDELLPRAERVQTAEAADCHPQAHDATGPREMQRPAGIAVMDMIADRATGGTVTERRGALHFQENGRAIETNQRNGERGGNQRAGHRAPQTSGLPYYHKRPPSAPQQVR